MSLVLAGGLIGAVIGPNLANHTREALGAPFLGSYLALAVVALVSMGQGVAVVPASMVGHVQLPGVVYRSIQGSDASSWLSLIHRRFEQAPAVARYLQQIKQTVAAVPSRPGA